ncbi:2-oxo-4-hydroxy-4-carboxy-5-ureidoimidazoline decarboxylase [Burkholderia aenigmatica]|uniref:2-oxo-4-hydroxy-4-carboxy-5-ureidoimidazoline decarboxylase n=1 Tax=Burkholderia aenigmatica TaxID=2015348 RepID=UPI0026523B1E|nr:2-oxo-4-hydroxy-4-carboxy-5-ureidoimidazoline decarboxylase [Burkholderia aenigmatica]MDN7880564.1 2-oxo-4-hydroxy-4-carboxy-5-ureidoimidazoline decarboxylase [Burkholderia aenigmatica]
MPTHPLARLLQAQPPAKHESSRRPSSLLVVLAAGRRNETRTVHFHHVAHAPHASGHAGCVRDSTQSPGDSTSSEPSRPPRKKTPSPSSGKPVSEQTSAGLDALTDDDDELRPQRMNRAYREQHGFPFIICVRHYTKAGIFFEPESRVSRESAFELDYALNQIKAIPRRRLDQRVG